MTGFMKYSCFGCIILLAISVVQGQRQDYNQSEIRRVGKRSMVPGMFIFGDSLIDNGNNNDLLTFAWANYFPYGIDFLGGPTGRFSNGFTIVDQISEMLGLPLIPAHSEVSTNKVFRGVNYASAAAGILDATGMNFVSRIPFNRQIKNFASTLDQVRRNSRTAVMAERIGSYIFFVGMGSNDYLNNYLMPDYPTKNQYNAFEYADLLIKQYRLQLISLYKLGARKFVISGLGSIGCIPSIRAQSPDGRCNKQANLLIEPFNANAKAMINNLNVQLPGAKFIFIDIARLFDDLIDNAKIYGFSVTDEGCCGVGRNRGQLTCLPMETPCPNRDDYVFWDAFHPTQAVNVLFGKKAFNGDPRFVFPMNIHQLALLPNI
ncbi:GDSL esterase/lipase At1g71691-like [Rutidosis leptorrhynchoides]|uniref:GDSL esterase/lipase At1g71691-like n=1 Tax=Rutidosis leptorrhynchoides TaxID=125765 RepID=UPI003A9A5CFD